MNNLRNRLSSFLSLTLIFLAGTPAQGDDLDLRYRQTKLVPMVGRGMYSVTMKRYPDGKIHLDDLAQQTRENYLSGNSAAAESCLFMLMSLRRRAAETVNNSKEIEDLSKFGNYYMRLESPCRPEKAGSAESEARSAGPHSETSKTQSIVPIPDFHPKKPIADTAAFAAVLKNVSSHFCGQLQASSAGKDSPTVPIQFPPLSIYLARDGSFLNADLAKSSGDPGIDRMALTAAVLAEPTVISSALVPDCDSFQIDIQLSSEPKEARIVSAIAGTGGDVKELDELKKVMRSSGLVCESAEDWALLAYYWEDNTEDLVHSEPCYAFTAWRQAYLMDRRREYGESLCQSLAQRVAISSMPKGANSVGPKERPLAIGKLYQLARRYPAAECCYKFQLFLDPQNESATHLMNSISRPAMTEQLSPAALPRLTTGMTSAETLKHMVDWLPPDSETIVYSRLEPLGWEENADSTEKVLSSLKPFEALISAKSFNKGQCIGTVSGSCMFRSAQGLGAWTYKGATLFLYQDLDRKKLDAVIGSCHERFEEHGIQVFCHHEKMENDDLPYFYCLPAPNVLAVATDRQYLRSLLDRMYSVTDVSRDSVKTRPEFQHVDLSKPYWAVRHYDWKSIPYQGMGSPFISDNPRESGDRIKGLMICQDGSSDCVTFQFLVPDQKGRATLEKRLELLKSPTSEYKVTSWSSKGELVTATILSSGDHASMARFFLSALLGYAVNL